MDVPNFLYSVNLIHNIEIKFSSKSQSTVKLVILEVKHECASKLFKKF